MFVEFEVSLEREFDFALVGGEPQTFTAATLRRT